MPLDEAVKAKVIKQIEFYFSESNLPRDKFLLETVSRDPDGFVSLGLLCTFSRMRALLKLADGTKEDKVPKALVEELATLLRERADSLVISEDGSKARRKEPLPDQQEVVAQLEARSLYAAPFPFDTGLDQLQAFFEQQGTVRSVRMRRHLRSGDFKGSVFVEFDSEGLAKEVMQKELVYEGAPLKMEPRAAYVQRKQDERHARPNSPHNQMDVDDDDDADLAADAASPADAAGPSAAAAKEDAAPAAPGADGAEGGDAAEAGAERGNGNTAGAAPAEAPALAARQQFDIGAGCIVRLEFGAVPEGLTYRALKDLLPSKEDGLRFVEFHTGEQRALARFQSAEAAKAFLDSKPDGKLTVGDAEASLALLEGEEEAAYIAKVQQRVSASIERAEDASANEGRGRGRGRGGGRGRFGGGRGRGGGGGRGGGRGRGGKREHSGGGQGGGRGSKQQKTSD